MRLFACTVLLGLAELLASCAAINDVAPKLKQDAECMLRVLKSVPGIDHVKMGVTDNLGWVHPFLEYRAVPEPDGYRAIVVFEAIKEYKPSDEKSSFEASLSGLMSPGQSELPLYGSTEIAKLLDDKCDVRVDVLLT
jgi:hypothetical protein